MPNSHHPFEKVTGGKGDRDIRTDPSKFRDALYWKRSTCCNARVGLWADKGTYYCKKCGSVIQTNDS